MGAGSSAGAAGVVDRARSGAAGRPAGSVERHQPSATISAAFSAIIITAAFGLPLTRRGMVPSPDRFARFVGATLLEAGRIALARADGAAGPRSYRPSIGEAQPTQSSRRTSGLSLTAPARPH